MLVTFLWRETEPLEHVVVVGGPSGFSLRQNLMTKLPGSDVWYRSYPVRSDSCRGSEKFIESPRTRLVRLSLDLATAGWRRRSRPCNFVIRFWRSFTRKESARIDFGDVCNEHRLDTP